MSTEELIQRLNELASWSSQTWANAPRDMPGTLYKAAATIDVLRAELKYLLDKEREI